MDLRSQEIISDQNFIKEILFLKTRDEVKNRLLEKGARLTDDEFEDYTDFLMDYVSKVKNRENISDTELEDIAAGSFLGKSVRFVGKTISFPFRAVSYAAGAVISSVPKGFIDGIYDSWTNWKYEDRYDQ